MAYSKIEGERLDIVLQKLREKSESGPLDGAEEFAALLNRSDGITNFASIESQIVDYVMPLIKDPAIFQENNIIRLLEYVRDDIIPSWPDKAETKELLRGAVNDVVVRYYDLLDRRNAGIAA